MLIDDDDKNLTRVMIGGAVLVNILVFAVGYDVNALPRLAFAVAVGFTVIDATGTACESWALRSLRSSSAFLTKTRTN